MATPRKAPLRCNLPSIRPPRRVLSAHRYLRNALNLNTYPSQQFARLKLSTPPQKPPHLMLVMINSLLLWKMTVDILLSLEMSVFGWMTTRRRSSLTALPRYFLLNRAILTFLRSTKIFTITLSMTSLSTSIPNPSTERSPSQGTQIQTMSTTQAGM
ncbi:MAG: hypothetical protein BWY72_02570 [Bacteroidetes bacterium ADurb.Bin416]|nr:MAG: hypothetical protein BWY72_02570 [Bacteroidetes bacterium ADurb.Bin416]